MHTVPVAMLPTARQTAMIASYALVCLSALLFVVAVATRLYTNDGINVGLWQFCGATGDSGTCYTIASDCTVRFAGIVFLLDGNCAEFNGLHGRDRGALRP